MSHAQVKQESGCLGISECHVTYQSAQALKRRLITMQLSADEQFVEAS